MDYTKSENEYATPGILEKEKHTVVEIIMRKERNELERNVESQNVLLDAISSLALLLLLLLSLLLPRWSCKLNRS